MVTGTPLIDDAMKNFPGLMDPYTDVSIGRAPRTDEGASVVTRLCSEGAAFVNGHALAIGGGQRVK